MANIYFFKLPLEEALGGAEFHTLQLAKHFSDKGHKVKLFTSDAKLFRLFEQNQISRKRIWAGWEPTSQKALLLWPVTQIVGRLVLRKIVGKAPKDTVYFCQSLTEKLLLTPLAAKQKAKVIWLEHKTPGRWLEQNPLRYQYETLAQSSTLVTVSDFAKKQFINFGIKEGRIKTVYPGVRLGSFNQKPKTHFTIGILSRLDPEKAVLGFLKTLSLVLKKQTEWKVLIAGEGSQKAEIESFIKKNSFDEQIKTLSFVNNLDNFFTQISVLCYPSHAQESFGIAALEAQARGVPVVASGIGALPEIINHEKNGFLVNTKLDWEKFLIALQNPDIYKKTSLEALENAKKFSTEKMLGEFDSLLL